MATSLRKNHITVLGVAITVVGLQALVGGAGLGRGMRRGEAGLGGARKGSGCAVAALGRQEWAGVRMG